MRFVYLLKRHPRHPYGFMPSFMRAADVVGVFAESKEPKRIAKEKNAQTRDCFWTVQRKEIKP